MGNSCESPHKDTFVVTGTGTGVGKTLVSAILTAGLGARYWKPVQSGIDPEGGTDIASIARLLDIDPDHPSLIPSAYTLREPQSPHFAAEQEGIEIDPNRLTVPDSNGKPLIIEGAGGVLVPLNRKLLYADLFATWQLPVIVVAGLYLGAINHTLLTLEALRKRNVPIQGLIWSGRPYPAVQEVIANFDAVPVLGHIPYLESSFLARTNTERLAGLFQAHIKGL